MAKWTVSDGTELVQDAGGVVVRGESALAASLRSDLAAFAEGAPRDVEVGPPPGGCVELEPSNVWVVDRWVRQAAARRALSVESDYVPDVADAPAYAHVILARRFDDDPPGTIY